MPQEFLRDVLRSGDVSGRARRRLSIFPVTIAIHVFVLLLFLAHPYLSDGELPAIWGGPVQAAPMMATPVPPSPPPPSSSAPTPRVEPGAPVFAPDRIVRETPAPPPNDGVPGGVPVGPGVNTGAAVLGELNFSAPPPAPPVPQAPVKPVPVGGLIREPRKLVHVAPEYPEMAQRARVQGMVILEATLDVKGNVSSLRVMRSQPLLEEAAIRAVKQWRYTPTLLNGVPVPVLMTITVNFQLR
jgi:protein TonB